MRTTVRLPEDLLARAKLQAARDNTTVTALITEGLRYVLEPARQQKAPRILPRVSTAVGRQLLGTVKTSELLEHLDEDLPIEKRR